MMKSTLAVALIATAAFGGVKTYGAYAGASESDTLLAENVEALSGDGEYGAYTKSTGKCSSPCSHKKWVSCKSGGTQECYPSDCC